MRTQGTRIAAILLVTVALVAMIVSLSALRARPRSAVAHSRDANHPGVAADQSLAVPKSDVERASLGESGVTSTRDFDSSPRPQWSETTRAAIAKVEARPLDDQASRAKWGAEVDAAMNRLLVSDEMRDDLPLLLTAWFDDVRSDPLVRNYAVQYLGWHYESQVRAGGIDWAGIEPAKRIRSKLWAVAEHSKEQFAGTALLALLNISAIDSNVPAERVSAVALGIINDRSIAASSRITAMSVCGRLHNQEAEPLAVQYALHGKLLPERVAAVATLGELGARESLLELGTMQDSLLAKAVDGALAKAAAKKIKASPEEGLEGDPL